MSHHDVERARRWWIWVLFAAVSSGCGEDAGDGSAAGGAGGSAGTGATAGSGGSAGSSGGAGSAGSAGAGGCPLGPEAKALVEEVTIKAYLDASFVAFESHGAPARIALALSLVGTTSGMLASFSPIQACQPGQPASWYATYCSDVEPGGPAFFDQIAPCSRWGCDAGGKTLVEVWYNARPQTELEPRHEITYAFEGAPESSLAGRTGTVTWAKNPYELWTRTDENDGSVSVVADAEHAVTVALDGGPTLDLSHTVHSEVENDPNGEAVSQLVGVAFAAVAGDATVSSSIELSDPVTHALFGNVVLNGLDVVALLQTSETAPPTLAWQGVCADAGQ